MAAMVAVLIWAVDMKNKKTFWEDGQHVAVV